MQTKEIFQELFPQAQRVLNSRVEDELSSSNAKVDSTDQFTGRGETETDLSRDRAAQAGMAWIDLSDKIIPPEVIAQITADDARRFKIVPIGIGEMGLIVAISDPFDLNTIDSVGFVLQREVELVCSSPEQIQQALIKYYGTADEASDALLEQIGHRVDLVSETVDTGAAGISETDAPIIRMVSMLLLQAYQLGASDIHLEPLEKKFRVRFRIDGVLEEVQSPPKRLQAAIISRLKIMTGSMSIAEKRLPQDGRIPVRIAKNRLDLRVSTIPTNHGESVVLRILDRSTLMLDLAELGLDRENQEQLEGLLRLPDGMLLVTGPTGSGKTSTLYSCLDFINQPDRKIITVEDPVEYQATGINQVQVNSQNGMTFPVALRSILRQAPNVIMLGEIRDLETATIATNASLTGHLLLSTLHTNDAPSAVARLIDLGLQRFLIASSMRGIIAQRLVRRLCPHCRRPGRMNTNEIFAFRLDTSPMRRAEVMFPTGCDQCRRTGYKGRIGVFEIFLIDDQVRKLINNRCTTSALREYARRAGMRTLREDAMRKLLAGLTSAEEVIATTVGQAD